MPLRHFVLDGPGSRSAGRRSRSLEAARIGGAASCGVALLALAALAPGQAQAADVFVLCTNNFFDQASCWGGQPPDELDRAVSSSGSSRTLLFDSAVLGFWQSATGSTATTVTNSSLLIQNGPTTFRSDDGIAYNYRTTGTAVVNSGGTLNIGAASNPMNFIIGNDTRIETGGRINLVSGSRLDVDDQLLVGAVGTGSVLSVASGSDVNSREGVIGVLSTADGTATVDGVGSSWVMTQDLLVGSNGTGTLNITDTANVANNFGRIGAFSGSKGTVNVGGLGVWTNAGDVEVGSLGTGVLNISGGSRVANVNGVIAKGNGTTGNVSVSGNAANINWENSGTLTIGAGADSTASLSVSGGGRVANTSAVIAGGVDSTAAVTVNGARWNSSGTLAMATQNRASATLNIVSGSSVSSAGAELATGLSNSTARVTVQGSGSTWNVTAGAAKIGVTGRGTLNIFEGGRVISGSGSIGDGSVADDAYGFGTVLVVGDDNGLGALSRWDNTGSLLVGNLGSGSLQILAGGQVRTGSLLVAAANSGSQVSSGQVDVFGENALLDVSGTIEVGRAGLGILNVSEGASAKAAGLNVGRFSGSSGDVSVIGAGTTFELNDSANINIGLSGSGTMRVAAGARLTSVAMSAGQASGSTGSLAVSGTGSSWVGERMSLGLAGFGSLSVSNGGAVDSGVSTIARDSGSAGAVTVSGADSNWAYGTLTVGSGGNGVVTVTTGGTVAGDEVIIGDGLTSTSSVFVEGIGSSWSGDNLIVGNSGSGALSISDGGNVSSRDTSLGAGSSSTGTVTVAGAASSWSNSGNVAVGLRNSGTLNIRSGASASSQDAILGELEGSTGIATVDGAGSSWAIGRTLEVGRLGSGTLNITNGGSVTSRDGMIALATGAVTVDGFGSSWNVDRSLVVGNGGTGTLDIRNRGSVSSTEGFIGSGSTATVDGIGSSLLIANSLRVGDNAALNITNNATATAGGLLEITASGSVDVTNASLAAGSLDIDGAFNFNSGAVNVDNDLRLGGSSFFLDSNKLLTVGGTTTIEAGNSLTVDGTTFTTGALVNNGSFGFVKGQFNLTGSDLIIGGAGLLGDTVSFDTQQIVQVAQSTTVNSDGLLIIENGSLTSNNYNNQGEVVLSGLQARVRGNSFANSGLLRGDGRLDTALTNTAAGEVRAQAGQRLLVTGSGNTNSGEINLLGGALELSQDLTNTADGFIAGRGTLAANGGLTNEGVVAFTSGNSDVLGDVVNTAGGRFVISGRSTVTFFDDVLHNGAEIRISSEAEAVFFGTYSGAGAITGTGTSFFEGDLRPGNSPTQLTIEGDSVFGFTNTTVMELAGLQRGIEYDAIDVGGMLTLGGTLEIIQIDGFEASYGDSFDLLRATTIDGTFFNEVLPELGGPLFWTTEVIDLDGSSVFRAQVVPIPAAVWMFGSGLALLGWFRRRTLH